jgi:hypothetical protein
MEQRKTGLAGIPTEILYAILQYLYLIDLHSLILSQRTNRCFRDIGQEIISRQLEDPKKSLLSEEGQNSPPTLNPLLRRKFLPLFNGTDCFTAEERKHIIYLTLAGDNTLPFKRLAWARDRKLREAYLRPEASWRDLGVARPGQQPITRLEVIRSYTSDEGDEAAYGRLTLAPPDGALTMGALYDALLSDRVHFGRETGDWELLPGRRLRDHALLLEYECFIADDPDLVDGGPAARHCAILYVQGAALDEEPRLWPAAHEWTPAPAGEPIRMLSWEESVAEDLLVHHAQI